jgi:hypothetical protein
MTATLCKCGRLSTDFVHDMPSRNPFHHVADTAVSPVRRRSDPAGGAVCSSTAGAGAVAPGPAATLRTGDDRHGLAAPVADAPQLDGGEVRRSDRKVCVTAIRAGAVAEVVQLEDRNPSAGGCVAAEGHVTDGGIQASHRQGVATPGHWIDGEGITRCVDHDDDSCPTCQKPDPSASGATS